MKKKSFLISSLVIVFLVLLSWVAIQVIGPKAVPKIKWSGVKSESRLISSILFSLKPQIERADFILIGVPSNEPQWSYLLYSLVLEVVQEVKLTRQKDTDIWVASPLEEKFLQENTLVNVFDFNEIPDSTSSDLGRRLTESPSPENVTLIVSGVADVLSYYPELRGGYLRKQNKNSLHLLFSEVQLPDTDSKSFLFFCDTSGKLGAMGTFGCEITQSSRVNYKKIKKTKEPIGFLMNQISERDYLILINREKSVKE